MLRALCLALLVLTAGCSSNVDSWADSQAKRLTQAGVTYPPEQERNTVVALATTCVWKDGTVGDGSDSDLQIYTRTIAATHDWLSPADALAMWRLADPEFCASVPKEPLGENR